MMDTNALMNTAANPFDAIPLDDHVEYEGDIAVLRLEHPFTITKKVNSQDVSYEVEELRIDRPKLCHIEDMEKHSSKKGEMESMREVIADMLADQPDIKSIHLRKYLDAEDALRMFKVFMGFFPHLFPQTGETSPGN